VSLERISKHDDYRDFLLFLANEKRSLHKRFSFQIFAKKLGVSKSYLKMVVDKKRHISIDRVFAVSRYFKLSDIENQYFIFLFLMNTTKDKSARNFFNVILKSHVVRSEYNRPQIDSTDSVSDEPILSFDWVKLCVRDVLRLNEGGMSLTDLHRRMGGDSFVSYDELKTTLYDAGTSGSHR
jgi:uncharacterized protein (TIGR02147 family)